jgi:hypothetical protein
LSLVLSTRFGTESRTVSAEKNSKCNKPQSERKQKDRDMVEK